MEGRIQVRNYENNEGKRVYVTEVIADNVRFLESNREGGAGGGGQREEAPFGGGAGGNASRSNISRGNQNDPFSDDGKPIDISDDDLPF
ncbi:Single-stranded DNA-binding protein ssb [compost metagenome]